MRVLAVASEVAPLAKTGGLADVAGALPLALAGLGVEMVTLIPGYRGLLKRTGQREVLKLYDSLFGGPASLVATDAAGLELLVLDAPHLFDRTGGPYVDGSGHDWPDNWRRFAAFSRVAADIAEGALPAFVPDVMHAHDWQAGLAPAYLRYGPRAHVPSVMTVHNIAFQGRFAPAIFGALGLPAEAMSVDGVEYYGGVGYLKAGLQAASAITTVSPTYAREVRSPSFGMGLEGLLEARAEALHGILNGVDADAWNPATDPHLAATYDAARLKRREANRSAILDRFRIDAGEGPLVCVISRLTWQKGFDILASVLDEAVEWGVRFAILGSGEPPLEHAMAAAAHRHPGRVGTIIGYDEGLAHLLQGGADAIVIPSRFEPCGLTQLYGLHYGCVPVVARTGGLADTVIDANEAALAAGAATGIVFAPENGDALLDAFRRLRELHAQPALWSRMQKQGMKADVSWRRSAARYLELYRSLTGRQA